LVGIKYLTAFKLTAIYLGLLGAFLQINASKIFFTKNQLFKHIFRFSEDATHAI
jgi:hypothetical protein